MSKPDTPELPPLPHRIGYVSRHDGGLRFTENVYNGADQHEIAGQKQFQPVVTVDQATAYAAQAVKEAVERERERWAEMCRVRGAPDCAAAIRKG